IPLAQAATFLATCPKSNAAYQAMLRASEDVRARGALPVPLHLRNAPTPLMKGLGYGADYRYPHDHPDAVVDQEYLPERLAGRRYYEPTDRGRGRGPGDRGGSARAPRKAAKPGSPASAATASSMAATSSGSGTCHACRRQKGDGAGAFQMRYS